MKTQSNFKLFGTFRQSAAKLAAAMLCLCGAFAATAEPLKINVIGVAPDGTQTPITSKYRWTVEEDATKLSVPGRPATTANYSFSFHTSYMPVIAAGRADGTMKVADIRDPDVAQLYAQTPPDVCPSPNKVCLEPGKDSTGQPLKRYYVSVAAEGFQMGGAPVVFSGTGATATVYVNQYPLPTAQVSVFAFNDNNPINGAPDLPQETGLAGFTVQLFEAGGTYGQSGGQVTQDGFGNPLGTTYNNDGSVKKKGAGIILTGPDGTAVIKNLFPAKYTVVITPPVNSDWHQTSTIEGTRGSDAWVKNNEPSFFQEFGPPGHHVFIGFTRSGCVQGAATGSGNAGRCNGLTGAGSNTISGRIVNVHNSRTPNYAFEKGAPVPECWVGLNETGGGTRALYATPCNKDSTFTIPKVPNGTYELVVWDEPLDMIIGTQTITVAGNLPMGDVPVFSWFGRYQGRVFQDIDGTGLPFFAEPYSKPYIKVDPLTGIETAETKTYAAGDLKPAFGEGIASNIRFRDGSIYQSATTKADGTFAFTELFPFFNWMIAEIDYARFKATGATMVPDAGGVIDPAANAQKLWNAKTGSYGSSDPAYAYNPWIRLNPQLQETCDAAAVAANLDADGKIIDATKCFKVGDKYYRTEQGVVLLEGMQTFLGQTNHIEWGKQPYAGQVNGPKDENGGIAGIVHYAITRAEDDPRYATAENWEPGIPRVQVALYLDCDGDGKIDKPKNDGSGQCADGGLSGANKYVADLPDVDNYPFCWRAADDPVLCPSGIPGMGPEDVKRVAPQRRAEVAAKQALDLGVNVTEDDFLFGDIFRWGAPNQPVKQQTATGLGKTDSWDDNSPTGCIKAAAGAVGNGSIPFDADLDCFDGLYNFNQLRPSVFDGGYAFGRVAGQAELPVFIGKSGKGTYIVEAKAPPGYLHQGNGDKNVTFGDQLRASTAGIPNECVGMELDVPAKLTLFADGTPDTDNPNFATGAKWRKCDMKAVPLLPGTNPAPDFHMFTEAPVAGHGVGFILDDTATEFNRFSPSFGEKYAPPHLPVSVQDWTGREITRVYSDQFGSYNFLVPSSFTINPPFPSGVMPNMIVSCMNHPGPIVDERQFKADGVTPNPTYGQKIIDPFFNRKYTQFCYTLQYLPGKTTYLDTPVLPIAAFASVEKNPLDCDCQDKTPAIYSANNTNTTKNYGPWVPATGGTLNIVSAGAAYEVPNPAYDPTVPDSPKNITRDYSFGAGGTVTLGGVALTPSSWSPDLMVLPVPATMPQGAHQLIITRADSGKESVVGITVHVGGTEPITVKPGASIQAVIDAPTTPAGALITIPPGTYNEYLILDKRVRLQGWGANSVTINSSKASAGGLAAWRTLLNKKIDPRCSLADGTTPGAAPNFVTYPQTGCPASTPVDVDTGGPTLVAGPNRTFDPLLGQTLGINKSNNEPILFGAEEGAGILALGKASGTTGCARTDLAYRIDGLSLTGSDSGGGILASGYNCDLKITNNRVMSNYGTYGGGIRVGHTSLVGNIPVAGTATTAEAYSPGFNNNVVIDHNWITQNGASEIASGDGGGGGVTLGTGSNNYVVSNNYICGNYSMSDGGGISHVGLSGGTSNIVNNKIILNQTFNQSADPTGGGLYIGGQVALGGGASDGTGKVNVDRNLIQYNHAGAGAGGGVSIARTSDAVLLTNNMIVNNATAYAGGGVAVADVSANTRLVNNTVADNTSTATNRQSFPPGPKVASTPQIAGIAQVGGAASPTLLNNIVWGNKSFTWSIDRTGPIETTKLNPVAGYWDLGKAGNPSHTSLPSSNSILSAGSDVVTNCTNCRAATADQIAFVRPIDFTPGVDPDQIGVLPETTIMQTALTFDEGGNFINVIFSPLTLWDIIPGDLYGTLRADYHIKGAAGAGTVDSIAINAGAARTANNFVPLADFDGQNRTGAIDVGADEIAQASPVMRVTPASLGYGVVMANSSKTLTVTVSNTGNANLVLAAPTITGGSAGLYSVVNHCATGAPGLNPGASCTMDVSFNPTATILLASANLNVNSANNLPLSIAVPLTGTGFVPTYTITPGPLSDTNFGNQQVGTQSAPRQFTLTNSTSSGGNLQLNGQPTLTGNFANQFQAAFRTGDTCTATTSLAPGASCTLSVVFAPTSTGSKGNIFLGLVNPGARVGVSVVAGLNTGLLGSPVRGAGVAPSRTVSPTASTLTFPATTRGNVSATQTVTVNNTGIGPLAVNSITFTGANAANWQQTNTCGASVAVNANCTISVQFAPTIGGTAGARNATLSIVDAAGTTTKAVNGTAN